MKPHYLSNDKWVFDIKVHGMMFLVPGVILEEVVWQIVKLLLRLESNHIFQQITAVFSANMKPIISTSRSFLVVHTLLVSVLFAKIPAARGKTSVEKHFKVMAFINNHNSIVPSPSELQYTGQLLSLNTRVL